MLWLVLVILVIAIVVVIALLNRFYRKATREVALIRTGAGGQHVYMDGGFLSLPFLHSVSEVNMKTTRLEMQRVGERSVITADRLRVDVTVEFYVRVNPSEEGVATAAQALAGKTFRASDLAETLEGKLVDAVLAVAARYSMDELQNARGKFVQEVASMLHENLAANGLLLESVSLTQLDQTPFNALEENNAFNAVGMRHLAQIVATSKKQRAAIEADAEVAVRESKLNATKQRLLLEQQEQEAQIEQHLHIEKRRADSDAAVIEEQTAGEQRREFARISREREVKAREIQIDKELREEDIEAKRSASLKQLESEIVIAAKQSDVSKAEAAAELARIGKVQATEETETVQALAIAEREKQLSLVRALEQAQVDDTRVKSEAETVLAMANAESEAKFKRAEADKTSRLAEAEGVAALISAENSRSAEQVRMKVDLHKMDTLPKVVDSMVKPAEKIDSIRINHITGFGNNGVGGSGAGADKPVVNQVTDGVLSMALQLPAIKKLGEEIGINIGDGVKGLGDTINDTNATQATADAARDPVEAPTE